MQRAHPDPGSVHGRVRDGIRLRGLIHLVQEPGGQLAFFQHFRLVLRGFVRSTFLAFGTTGQHGRRTRGLSRTSGHDETRPR